MIVRVETCTICSGKGCDLCNGTGREEVSVEGRIRSAILYAQTGKVDRTIEMLKSVLE